MNEVDIVLGLHAIKKQKSMRSLSRVVALVNGSAPTCYDAETDTYVFGNICEDGVELRRDSHNSYTLRRAR